MQRKDHDVSQCFTRFCRLFRSSEFVAMMVSKLGQTKNMTVGNRFYGRHPRFEVILNFKCCAKDDSFDSVPKIVNSFSARHLLAIKLHALLHV